MGSAKKPRIAVTIVGVAILAAAVVVVLFSGASGITRENIEKHLARFNAFITEEAARNHREAKFSTGDILMEGWGYNKTGTVLNITLEIAQKTLLDTNKLLFSTSKMQVLPDPVNPSRLFFTFPDTIHVIENSELVANIDFPEPLRYGFFDGYDGKQHTMLHTLHSPPKIILTSPNTPTSTPDEMVITYDGKPVAQTRILPELQSQKTDYAFENVRITSKNGEVTIANLVGHQEESTNENITNGKYELNVVDLLFKDEANPKPYSLSADISYMDGRPQDASQVKIRQFTVNKIALIGDGFRVSTNGSVVVEMDDPLPSGLLNVEIENAGKLVQSELVPAALKDWVNESLQRATGAPVDAETNAKFVLRRDKNGVFYVGITTFEALAASLFTHLLQLTGPAGKIVLPPEQSVDPDGSAPTYNDEPITEPTEPAQ